MAIDINEQTDEQLLAEASREDADGPAFVALVDRHRERVWRICFRVMGNEHDAGDAAQEVFVRLFFSRTKFSGQSKFATWLHGIAVRTCLSMRRSRGRRAQHETVNSEAATQATATAACAPELSLDLERMLAVLDEEDRALLVLKFAEGYSYEELATMFELSASAVKMRISRAKDKLREKFPNQSI